VRILAVFALCAGAAGTAGAQVSFRSAIDLALKHNPRVKIAEDDLKKASALLSEEKDLFIPSVTASSGLGASSGITLSVPTIFTVNAHSSVFSFSQLADIRAGRSSVQAAALALADVRLQVEEDTATTYIGADYATARLIVIDEQYQQALRLVAIVQDRIDAGVDNELELKKARRAAVAVSLRRLELENKAVLLRMHLAQLIGISLESIRTISASIPSQSALLMSAQSVAPDLSDAPGILSARADARAKHERSFADSRYTWLPQITFDAQYGRISPFNDVSSYYNLHGNYNTLAAGVQIQIPILDQRRKASARESAVDAMQAEHKVALLTQQENETRLSQRHSVSELKLRAELTELDHDVAKSDMGAVLVRCEMGGGSRNETPTTPKEKLNAGIRERQAYVEMLEADGQLREALIHEIRQQGQMDEWLRSVNFPRDLTSRSP